eukprot:6213423-Pleurochrysis_carterae.AAC.1
MYACLRRREEHESTYGVEGVRASQRARECDHARARGVAREEKNSAREGTPANPHPSPNPHPNHNPNPNTSARSERAHQCVKREGTPVREARGQTSAQSALRPHRQLRESEAGPACHLKAPRLCSRRTSRLAGCTRSPARRLTLPAR